MPLLPFHKCSFQPRWVTQHLRCKSTAVIVGNQKGSWALRVCSQECRDCLRRAMGASLSLPETCGFFSMSQSRWDVKWVKQVCVINVLKKGVGTPRPHNTAPKLLASHIHWCQDFSTSALLMLEPGNLGLPEYCKMVSSIPGLYSLNVSSNPQVGQLRISSDMANVPWKVKLAPSWEAVLCTYMDRYCVYRNVCTHRNN